MVIADAQAAPPLVAADLLAGAEHDKLASAILTDSERWRYGCRIGRRGNRIVERASVAGTSIETHGGVIIVDSINEAIALANEFAPEHLCLHLKRGRRCATSENAGCKP
jgi:histidinol dehydrogenase